MNTKRALIIYTGLIAAIAMILISTFIGASKEADAAAGWNTVGTKGTCNDTTCSCPSTSPTGCSVWLHTCTEFSQYQGTGGSVCYDNPQHIADLAPGSSLSVDNILGGISCVYVQIDVNRPQDDSIAGYYGAITLEPSDWSMCDDNGGGGSDDTPPPQGCPYASTQARVHTSITEPWTHDLTLNACSTPVIVGSFHNNDGNFANDTNIQVVGPEVNVGLPNEGTFTAVSGEYTVYVRTRKPGSNDVYTEDACNATARVVCPADNGGEPDFNITKVATNDDGPYDIGDIVNFRVQIENTGDQTLNTIAYKDVFDHRYLQFVSVRGFSPAHPGGINMNNNFTLTRNGNFTTFSNDDITAQLGDLAAGQIIYFEYEFSAINPSDRACNDVFARPEGLSEEQARDCVGITISTDL